MIVDVIQRNGRRFGVRACCEALTVSRASYYRWLRPTVAPKPRRRSGGRRIPDEQRAQILAVLTEPRFVDVAPCEIVATLLDEDTYLCSPRTMYRILAENVGVRERRNQLVHPDYEKPQLVATAPNQLWSWDITKLRGPKKWTYYYLYILMDVFSRAIVGWMVASRESGALARRLFQQTAQAQGVQPGELIAHSDRGGPMRSKTLGQLFADLSITPSFSRPRVSNDNPYSEALFKTVKWPWVEKVYGALRGLT